MGDPATFESDATFDRASAVFRVGHVGRVTKGEFGECSSSEPHKIAILAMKPISRSYRLPLERG
jgi:hypothetical protein